MYKIDLYCLFSSLLFKFLQLENTVIELKNNSEGKILIVCKEHIEKWKNIIRYLEEKYNCDFFFLENV